MAHIMLFRFFVALVSRFYPAMTLPPFSLPAWQRLRKENLHPRREKKRE